MEKSQIPNPKPNNSLPVLAISSWRDRASSRWMAYSSEALHFWSNVHGSLLAGDCHHAYVNVGVVTYTYVTERFYPKHRCPTFSQINKFVICMRLCHTSNHNWPCPLFWGPSTLINQGTPMGHAYSWPSSQSFPLEVKHAAAQIQSHSWDGIPRQ